MKLSPLMAILPLFSLTELEAQLLGAGTGVGSCRAFPYRAEQVDWEVCPLEVPCCNEYGFCRSKEEWNELQFRDCNGVSNGIDLPRQVLQLENALGGVAGESLGAEKTFDISQVGGGAFGPGSGVSKNSNGGFNLASANGGSGSGFSGNGGGFGGSGGSNSGSGGSFGNGGSNSFNSGNGGTFSSNSNQNGGGNAFSSNRNQNGFSSSRNQNGGGRILNKNVVNRGQSSLSSSGPGNINSIEDAIFSNSGSNRFSNGGGISSTNRKSSSSSRGSSNNSQRNRGSLSSGTGGQKRNRGNNRNTNRNGNRGGSRTRNYGTLQNVNSNQVQQGGSGGYGGEVSGQLGGGGGSQLNAQGGSGASNDVNKFPFSDYVNTAGYPMNLNSENCPKYPFCWWNPYSRLNDLI